MVVLVWGLLGFFVHSFVCLGGGIFFDQQNTSLNAISSSNSSGERSGLHMHFYNVLGKKIKVLPVETNIKTVVFALFNK